MEGTADTNEEENFQRESGRNFAQLTASEAPCRANFRPKSGIRSRIAEAPKRGVAAQSSRDVGNKNRVSPRYYTVLTDTARACV